MTMEDLTNNQQSEVEVRVKAHNVRDESIVSRCSGSSGAENGDEFSLVRATTKIGQLKTEVTRSICTGQVVISLTGACRELIDNALDAGATNIEILARESGVEQLEVIDNGSGIEASNFDFLCKPHSTSKLATINDFNSLSTFGFRGEALNALAALSHVTICTRHSTAPVATRLHFDRHGCVTRRESCPRQVGTSVIVGQLFAPLPVRRQEFVRNARREFLKMLASAQSFALSRTDCRFSCANLVNGKRIQMLSSPGGTAPLCQVVASLFGAAAGSARLLAVKECRPDAAISQLYGVPSDTEPSAFDEIKLSGYVSSCGYGEGRNAADRQFVYVNRRPVDFTRVNRVVNEVYATFNRGQYCTLVLFIDVDPAKLDVNVSPDKRTVFLANEKELFAKLRASLHHTWTTVAGRCERSGLDGSGFGGGGTISALFRPPASAKRQKVAAMTSSGGDDTDDGERRISQLYSTQLSTDCIIGDDDDDEYGGNDRSPRLSTPSTIVRAACSLGDTSVAADTSRREFDELYDFDGRGGRIRVNASSRNAHGGGAVGERGGLNFKRATIVTGDFALSDDGGRKERLNHLRWPLLVSGGVDAGGAVVGADEGASSSADEGAAALRALKRRRRSPSLALLRGDAEAGGGGSGGLHMDFFEENDNGDGVDEVTLSLNNASASSPLPPKILSKQEVLSQSMVQPQQSSSSRNDKMAVGHLAAMFSFHRASSHTQTAVTESASASGEVYESHVNSRESTLEVVGNYGDDASSQSGSGGGFVSAAEMLRNSMLKRENRRSFSITDKSFTKSVVEDRKDASELSPDKAEALSQRTAPKQEDVLIEFVKSGRGLTESSGEMLVEEVEDADAQLIDGESDREADDVLRPQQTLAVSLSVARLRETLLRRRLRHCRREENAPTAEEAFRVVEKHNDGMDAMSGNADDVDDAERKREMLLRREDFERMEVVGQFNQAFIIARLDDDLFMIDQHASDEKYNFERLKRDMQIASQKLISAQTLELGAVEESVLRDNVDILRANGFDFVFNESAPLGQRCCLTSVPTLHNWQFSNSDIDEILAVLVDFPGVMYRPVKLRRIFASRACRKSVMFGDALTPSQMLQILRHMGTMDQPWNCPHGRPTIRHLCRMERPSSSAVGVEPTKADGGVENR